MVDETAVTDGYVDGYRGGEPAVSGAAYLEGFELGREAAEQRRQEEALGFHRGAPAPSDGPFGDEFLRGQAAYRLDEPRPHLDAHWDRQVRIGILEARRKLRER